MSTLLKTKKKNCWICHQPSSTRISLHRIPEKEFVVKDAWLQILRVEERNIPRFLVNRRSLNVDSKELNKCCTLFRFAVATLLPRTSLVKVIL